MSRIRTTSLRRKRRKEEGDEFSGEILRSAVSRFGSNDAKKEKIVAVTISLTNVFERHNKVKI